MSKQKKHLKSLRVIRIEALRKQNQVISTIYFNVEFLQAIIVNFYT